jgi:hypothetical protein
MNFLSHPGRQAMRRVIPALRYIALGLVTALFLAFGALRPAAAQPVLGTGDPPVPTNPEVEGPGPQILTADLLARQEMRADKIVAHWTIVGQSSIKSITVNGKQQPFEPGDTVALTREFNLKISQTVITLAATDSKGDTREASYLIVNPGLPLKETETVAMVPEKLPEVRADLQKIEPEIQAKEAEVQKLFAKNDFSDWNTDPNLNQFHNRQVRLGLYPIWMEARPGNSAGTPMEVRAVYRPLPTDAVTTRAYWGLTPHQYNFLIEDLSKRGFQQVFREVLPSDDASWRVQTVWILKFDRR